ncbi:EF-hand domain-containing protein 1, partial [Quaeritorhiza haematococci]
MSLDSPLHDAIPSLLQQVDYRKVHTLDYKNGYSIQKVPMLGVGLKPIETTKPPKVEDLAATLGSEPALTYRDKRFHAKNRDDMPQFVPAHVAFDKVVLRFDGYFKQTVHESTEQYHLRKVRVYYYLEDDSIAVVEPPVENSGIPQGVLIKRQRLPKSSTEYYTIKDFNLGINFTVYGKTFRIVSCDKFTEVRMESHKCNHCFRYMRESEGINLNPPESMPVDLHQLQRNRPLRITNASISKPSPEEAAQQGDKLKRFLEFDRKVLRFYCIWDDRDSMFGELREF